MFENLVAGFVVISLTVLIHTSGLIATTHIMSRIIAHFRLHGRRSRILAIITVVMALFTIITAEVWLWAGVYVFIGAFASFATSLYFSVVTFSTLGYGDVVPDPTWRLMAAMEAINGFLLVGWSTAYLVASGTRVGPFRAGVHF
jgi:voltage-gated potassium channel Kch